MKKKYWEEILVALSAANLLFVESWRRLIYPTSDSYHIKLEPASQDYLAILLCVLITAAMFAGGFWLLRIIFTEKFILIPKLISLL